MIEPPAYTTTCPSCARVLPGPYEHYRYQWRLSRPGIKRRVREWCIAFEEDTQNVYYIPELFRPPKVAE
jgi:hypothetical protein